MLGAIEWKWGAVADCQFDDRAQRVTLTAWRGTGKQPTQDDVDAAVAEWVGAGKPAAVTRDQALDALLAERAQAVDAPVAIKRYNALQK